jgi:uncharacterized protein (DUF58 family)
MAEVTVAIRPSRRGAYRISPPVCESSFPFNLFYFGSQRRDQERLVVLPVFWRLDLALPYVSRHVNASSLRPAGRTGISPEYIGNRPYQPGDPPRRIDVRAWARLSVPATKEYDDDLDNYAALVLDTRLPGSPFPASEELEAAVSLCASVAYSIHGDCLIDLLLAGTDLHLFGSVPKTMRVDRIHETLAVVEPSPGYDAEQIGPLLEDRLSEISEVIFIVLRWDRTYQRLAELAEQAGCHCTAIVIGEPDWQAQVRSEEEKRVRTQEGPSHLSPSDLPTFAPSDPLRTTAHCRLVLADEILAGRRDLL